MIMCCTAPTLCAILLLHCAAHTLCQPGCMILIADDFALCCAYTVLLLLTDDKYEELIEDDGQAGGADDGSGDGEAHFDLPSDEAFGQDEVIEDDDE
jgi:hypothetical protein